MMIINVWLLAPALCLLLFSPGLMASLSQGDELPRTWFRRFLISLEKNGRRWEGGKEKEEDEIFSLKLIYQIFNKTMQ